MANTYYMDESYLLNVKMDSSATQDMIAALRERGFDVQYGPRRQRYPVEYDWGEHRLYFQAMNEEFDRLSAVGVIKPLKRSRRRK